MLDKSPLSIREFKGLHISDIDSQFGDITQGDIPFANAIDCLNLEFMKKGGLRTRNGIDTYENTFASATTVTGKPHQMFRIHNLKGVAQTDRWLILTWDGTTGRIYDTQVAGPATNPILSLTGMKYAYVINVFGRMYISPWKAWAEPNDASGANGWVHVYNGDYNARPALGDAPAVGTFAAAIAAGGSVTNGLHFVSVLFETDTGFKTTIPLTHAATPLSATAASPNSQINLTNIPVGAAGSGVIARHIIMSKVAVVNYNGFENDEPFFAGTISDNTTTTFSITVPDSALVESAADFLSPIDTHSIARACVSMSVYNKRMVYNGLRPSTSGTFLSDVHSVVISPPNLPEQISHLDESRNKLFIGIEYAGRVMNGAEYDGRYYIFKEDATFSIDEREEVETDDPSTWKVSVADPAKGAYPFGIGGSGDNPGSASQGLLVVNSNRGALLVVGNHGLSLFNGVFSDIPLSEYDLEDEDITALKWSQILVDGIRKNIFWRMGDPATVSGTESIRVGNFRYGLQLGKIRWGFWNFPSNSGRTPYWLGLRPPGTAGSVGPTSDFDTLYPLLTVLNWTLVSGSTYNCNLLSETNRVNDFARTTTGHWIPWLYETGYTPNNYGEVYTFIRLYLRALVYWIAGGNGGDASILAQFGLLDSSTLTTIGSFAPTAAPTRMEQLPLNAINEKIRLKLSGTNRVFIQNLTLATSETAKTRPSV